MVPVATCPDLRPWVITYTHNVTPARPAPEVVVLVSGGRTSASNLSPPWAPLLRRPAESTWGSALPVPPSGPPLDLLDRATPWPYRRQARPSPAPPPPVAWAAALRAFG